MVVTSITVDSITRVGGGASARSRVSARRQKWPNHSAEKIKISTYSQITATAMIGNSTMVTTDDTHSSVGAEPSMPTAMPMPSSGSR